MKAARENLSCQERKFMDKRTSVLIADNSEEFCSALCSELQRSDLFQVIGVANDGE